MEHEIDKDAIEAFNAETRQINEENRKKGRVGKFKTNAPQY